VELMILCSMEYSKAEGTFASDDFITFIFIAS
jgi:hypothetical protein